MIIYSMTATFGKLQNQTLTLQPGLNIIEAPNEWGKSTWCAFLVCMLYGIDTRAKTTKTALADKDRYAPWSGSPMSGRIDLCWNGRDITIERQTKGRLIFGDFQAYETATGLPVSELNGTNCGQMLLGVERSVFTRAGFLKLTDLPVTQDDALRRRLNNLVTTGDESGAGYRLQSTLRDLKNKCRANRTTGLLPQAEAQKSHLEDQLAELENLRTQSATLLRNQTETEQRIAQLENHKAALRYAAAQADSEKVAEATGARDAAAAIVEQHSRRCQALPSRENAVQTAQTGRNLHDRQMSLQMESQMLPPLPQPPEIPERYRDTTPDAAIAAAEADTQTLSKLEKRKKINGRIVGIYTAIAVLALVALVVLQFAFSVSDPVLGIGIGGAVAVGGIGVLLVCLGRTRKIRTAIEALYDRHPGLSPDKWISDAGEFAARQAQHDDALASAQAARGDLDSRKAALDAEILAFTGGGSLDEAIRSSEAIVATWDALGDARRDLQRAESHAQTLRSMAKTAEPPRERDELTYSESETDALLASARFELKQYQLKLGQTQGRADALGQEESIRTQLKTVSRRIGKLEDTYAALELALNALSSATATLQRRFAPRISKRAQALFQKMTDGRYDRLTLSEDLSLNTCTHGEEMLRPSLWRSDGTSDQLYLALRLAVAEELTPDAPLVLDDALVRFDNNRLAAAMDILRQTGQTKQVILFTCQGRETRS